MRRGKPARPIVLPPLPPLGPEDALPNEPAPAPPTEPEPARAAPVPPAATTAERRAADLRPLAMWERTAEIAGVLARTDARTRALMAGSVYPLAAYDRFRRDHPVRPPPGPLPSADGLVVIVDAAVAAPFRLRETLRSFQDQSVTDWTAMVVAPTAIRAHPVGSFGDIDPRFRFVDPSAFVLPVGPCLLLSAGTALDPQALAWLVFAAARTGADAVFADHDHGVLDADLGALRTEPWLYSAFDAAAFGWVPAPAAVWAAAPLAAASPPAFDGSEAWRRSLLAHAVGRRIAHVPRLIATHVELPITARGGRDTLLEGMPGRLGPVAPLLAPPITVPREDRIAVVIPTRDGADLLERAVASLRRTARLPERLDIVVVDNRSTQPETAALLARLAAEGDARVHPFDKPFNWGLANNEGAAATDAPLLVFANNDIEMLSTGWDDVVAGVLAEPGVGALGARLLYPNGTVQHGGVIFGMVPGHTEHEGRGAAASDPGPNRRLVTPRTLGAVTGAFLAVSRANWAALGGIDTAMGVAHSDFDFCFRLREQGLTIRYEPRIEAIHFESVTRGINSTKADVAWDESERTDLVARWGVEMVEDIGVSPYFARTGTPFETMREPSMTEIVRHIDRTARAAPWRPTRAADQRDAEWRAERPG